MGVSNAWRHREVGGFISVGVRSVGTSVAATVLRASMRPSMRRQQGIRSLPASSRVRIGSSITRSGGWSRVWSCFRRILTRRINQHLDRQGEFQPIGNRCCTSWRRSFQMRSLRNLTLPPGVRRRKPSTWRPGRAGSGFRRRELTLRRPLFDRLCSGGNCLSRW